MGYPPHNFQSQQHNNNMGKNPIIQNSLIERNSPSNNQTYDNTNNNINNTDKNLGKESIKINKGRKYRKENTSSSGMVKECG